MLSKVIQNVSPTVMNCNEGTLHINDIHTVALNRLYLCYNCAQMAILLLARLFHTRVLQRSRLGLSRLYSSPSIFDIGVD